MGSLTSAKNNYNIDSKKLVNGNDIPLEKPVYHLNSDKKNNNAPKNELPSKIHTDNEFIDKTSMDSKNGDKNEYRFSPEKTDDGFLDEDGKFSAEKFVHYLKFEGSKIPYKVNAHSRQQLPDFYDPIKFKRAVEVFQKYKFSMLLVILMFLLTLLIDKVGTKLFLMTNKTNNKKEASIRYKNSIKHMISWYSIDHNENSEFWKSMNRVKYLHYATNLKARRMYNMPQITQFELSASSMASFCFPIMSPEHVGMKGITDEEQEALLHYGKVIGYLLGVEDRFSICRGSVEDVKEILNILLDTHIKPLLELKDQDSLHLQITALEGVARFTFPIYPKSFLNYMYEILYVDEEERKKVEFRLSSMEHFYLLGFKFLIYCLRFSFIRKMVNNIISYILS